jgi:hypothetical protein
LKRQALPKPHPGPGQEDEEGKDPRRKERPELFPGERLDLLLSGRHGPDEVEGLGEFVGWVCQDDPIIDRGVEQDPEGRMDEPNTIAREAPWSFSTSRALIRALIVGWVGWLAPWTDSAWNAAGSCRVRKLLQRRMPALSR